MCDLVHDVETIFHLVKCEQHLAILGGALAWWLGRRILQREVGGSILTRVTVLCP